MFATLLILLVTVSPKIPGLTPNNYISPALSHFSYNEQKKNYTQWLLLEGPRSILKQLNNSNVAKVSIIKWSQNFIWAYGSDIFGIPKYLKMHEKQII